MSSITDPLTVSYPTNTWLNGITWGTRWYTPTGGGQTYIYYAAETTAGYVPNAAETAAYLQVFADISKICNVTFIQGTTAYADIVLASVNEATMASLSQSNGTLGLADPPGTYFDNTLNDYQSTVFANHDQYSVNGLNKGGYDYITWLHEIGHAMGLAHPHDTGGGSSIYPGVTGPFGSLGQGDLNQGIFTTMSYNDGWSYFAAYMPKQYGWQGTMMAFDVAAMQYLYGANYSTATGSNAYVLGDAAAVGASYQCIWDAGGYDQIYYGGSYGAFIDLRAATLDPAGSYGAGGFISYLFTPLAYTAFTIANGVTIEQAYSGSGNDTLVGNDSANNLYSNGGSDTVYGLGGNDFVWAGTGNDVVYGGTGNDSIYGVGGNDYLIGDAGSDGFNFYYDVSAGSVDYIADLTYGTDYALLPTAYNGQVYFYVYQGSAYGYIGLAGGGYYIFGAAGLTAGQLQASTYYY
jgi:serralysin